MIIYACNSMILVFCTIKLVRIYKNNLIKTIA
jgi:hypothetical protein